MSDPNVVPLALSKSAASRLIKEIGANPDNIVPVKGCLPERCDFLL